MKSINIELMLAKVQKLCEQRAVRLTPQRQLVLRLMAEQKNAISAYDLLDLLRLSEPQAKPPTVYRALDFLLEQGFIHKIESTNSYVVCHHVGEPLHTSALFICDSCGLVTEYHAQGIDRLLEELAEKSHFTIQHSVLETHGVCSKCVKA
ncbi:zinc uptake transcriptional repressor Zur [Pragia fontium]|uniref:Ferric uptake regulation protein n=2 Tax=Pragia fontium TaxID=82985 RepID=A0AAJ4W9J4_9GAMM|nr:zinc uptake transcriptional repressor Zur [Pragia fontium]AKJ43325.1 zinc uptake transcriptional repressor [Pragia fontium]SFC57786.1 Fur family transcriptional regulator, zinc uptake regulator [Pragia fontium DSM 5563 = ATCC 49100]SUB83795.1 Zinc uptake regulation protein [Pragia fontium]VEJ56699.1 Zinc uptake regulation protein [Pragia fontium]GKX64153.1 transcriptional regulator Zur [Pragia fontium]